MFTNEINALSKLRGYPHFPHLIAYDPKNLIIYMTYCGGLLTSENLPNNWRDQIHNIKEIMMTLNINSNDMLTRNTCCLNGEIKIIDFGLHTIFGRTIEEVIGDLYNNINILSSSKNKVDNSIKYKYMEEYPNWKLNLEKYKHKQVLIKKAQDSIKTYIKKEINTKRK
jgi:tRNA A-37 threonylcarbamoyl transferase component Bud32